MGERQDRKEGIRTQPERERERERERRMSSRSYDNPAQQVPSMAHEEPMRQRKVDTGFGHSTDDVEMEIAPLLHSEMEKIHGRTRCQTISIVMQTVLLVAIGLVIIAGIVVIALQFGELNASLNSLAETGEMAQPLIMDGTKLASNFNNLTGDLTSALGLGSSNGSLASGVQDFTSQIADAGKELFSGLQGAIPNVTQNAGGGQTTDPVTMPAPTDTSAAAPAPEADVSG